MGKGKIILVLGGQRSGKSLFAERMALSLCDYPVYLATARVLDREFEERVAIHRDRRGDRWSCIEEPLNLSEKIQDNSTVLVDCVTLWVTNMFFEVESDARKAILRLKEEFDSISQKAATVIFVSTETGLGGTSENAMQRRFNDIQGEINQYIASRADEVHLIVAGINVRIK